MQTAPRHATRLDLEQAIDSVLASPQDEGQLNAIFVRPREDERQAVASATLSPQEGVAGDRWATDHWKKLPDGSSDPQAQVSLMNSRILREIAGEDETMGLAGDNLIVDFDLSEANLPAGSRLQIGDVVVLELTAVPHTGCGKFLHRFGQAARDFINGPIGSAANLRGRFAQIITEGEIAVGDVVRKVAKTANGSWRD